MCGIAGYMAPRGAADTVIRMMDRMAWRGPDGRDTVSGKTGTMGHVRLAIIDPAAGHQPMSNADGSLWIAFNGEVYNHTQLRGRLRGQTLRTASDTEVVLRLFEQEGVKMLSRLLGMYAFAIWDRHGNIFMARDPVGIKPLYYGRDAEGHLVFASEIKAMLEVTDQVREFPPGCYYQTGVGIRPFYQWPVGARQTVDVDRAVRRVRRSLREAVQRCMVSDVPVGVFLSGGLDSSLVAALARRMHGPGLKSFAVGMVGAADLEWARRMADHLGTDHYEHAYTPAEVIAALPEVITHLESFDPPLVRSAVATWMCGRLAARHVKVVLTGEGADELFAGYHYLKEFAPDWPALDQELHRITRRLHNSNLQRADRQTMAHSVEARVPFLELPVVETAMAISPAIKLGPDGKVEKWLLRKAAEAFLPADVVWRKKEKFSLGTGTGQFLEQYAAEHVSDAELSPTLPDGTTLALQSREEALYWRHFAPTLGKPAILQGMGRSRTLGDYDRNPAAWLDPTPKAAGMGVTGD